MENQNNIVFEPEKPRINNPSNNIVLVETSFTKGYEKKIETWSLQELISEYCKVSALNCEKIETKTNLSGTLNKIKQQVLAKNLERYSLGKADPASESKNGAVFIEADPERIQALLLKLNGFLKNGIPFLIGEDTLVAHGSPEGYVQTSRMGTIPIGKVANETLGQQIGSGNGNITRIISCYPKAVSKKLEKEQGNNFKTFTDGQSGEKVVMSWRGGENGGPLLVSFQTESVSSEKRETVEV